VDEASEALERLEPLAQRGDWADGHTAQGGLTRLRRQLGEALEVTGKQQAQARITEQPKQLLEFALHLCRMRAERLRDEPCRAEVLGGTRIVAVGIVLAGRRADCRQQGLAYGLKRTQFAGTEPVGRLRCAGWCALEGCHVSASSRCAASTLRSPSST